MAQLAELLREDAAHQKRRYQPVDQAAQLAVHLPLRGDPRQRARVVLAWRDRVK